MSVYKQCQLCICAGDMFIDEASVRINGIEAKSLFKSLKKCNAVAL